MPAESTEPRRPRRDAVENRERLVEAALRAIARDGMRVPVATIAAEAGVGVATFYRGFADRDALMQELESRAYAELNRILDDIEADAVTGVPAVERFLVESLRVADRMVLPLHGAPPLVDAASVEARQRIDGRLERFLEEGRAASAVASEVNATDLIMCSALVTQPLQHGPHWERTARRHIAVFVAGLTSGRTLPGPPVVREDLEQTWTHRAGATSVG